MTRRKNTAPVVEENKIEVPSAEQIKDIKKRRPSAKPRDEDGKVIRVGRNLSGNTPWKYKHYYLDETVYAAASEAVAATPNQVQLILKSMIENKITDAESATTGTAIVDEAKKNGQIKTKIASNALFAYYRRLMETVGVVYVG